MQNLGNAAIDLAGTHSQVLCALRVKALGQLLEVRIVRTFTAAHVLPESARAVPDS